MLFGLPTLLYKTAFKGFKNKILSHSILNKYIDKGVLVIPSANNLQNEYLVAMVPNITKNVGEQKYTLISNELDSSLNKDFYEYLERIGFDKLKVMNVIDELWPDLLRYMGQKINLSLLEIQKN